MKAPANDGGGFIGSNIGDRLIAEGYDVIVIDDFWSGNEKDIHKKAIFYKLDLLDEKLKSIFQKEKPNYLSHHTDQNDVCLLVSKPVFGTKVNIPGTINIFQKFVENKIKKIIFTSTDGVI